jgi:hypothetical protein
MTISRLAPAPFPPWIDNALVAGDLAKAFLADRWHLSAADRTWFTVRSCQFQAEGWYRVELGIFGCPDTWVIRVYDSGQCDPCYAFHGGAPGNTEPNYTQILPTAIAAMLLAERHPPTAS